MSSRKSFGHAYLCLALHAALILLFIFLVVIAAYHREHGVNRVFTTSGQTAMSLTVSVISQSFGTVSSSTIHLQ